MSILVRSMQTKDLQIVLSWRNHPKVRSVMFSNHEIEPEEHATWFKNCLADASRKMVIFESDGSPRGFTNLRIDSMSHNAEWGFYVAPDAPKGTGTAMAKAVIESAFLEWGVHKISGNVLEKNERSRTFHAMLGFQLEGILRQHHFDGSTYQDVYQFGLLAGDRGTSPLRSPA